MCTSEDLEESVEEVCETVTDLSNCLSSVVNVIGCNVYEKVTDPLNCIGGFAELLTCSADTIYRCAQFSNDCRNEALSGGVSDIFQCTGFLQPFFASDCASTSNRIGRKR